MKKTNKAIGNRLKLSRLKKDMSLRDVANRTGVDHSTLRLIENGQSRLGYVNAVLLCAFYGITLAALAGEILTDTRGNIV